VTPADAIRAFISDSFFVEEYTNEESFLRSGTIDSTGMLELISFVEEHFGVEIDDEELVPDNLDSVDNLVGFLARKGVSTTVA